MDSPSAAIVCGSLVQALLSQASPRLAPLPFQMPTETPAELGRHPKDGTFIRLFF